MKRIYDKQPREHHRKRSHYNSRGVAKLSFDNEKAAERYIKKNDCSVTPHTFATSAIIGTLEGVKQNKTEKKSSSLPNSYDSFTFFTNQSPIVRCSASALCFNKKRYSLSIDV